MVNIYSQQMHHINIGININKTQVIVENGFKEKELL